MKRLIYKFYTIVDGKKKYYPLGGLETQAHQLWISGYSQEEVLETLYSYFCIDKEEFKKKFTFETLSREDIIEGGSWLGERIHFK